MSLQPVASGARRTVGTAKTLERLGAFLTLSGRDRSLLLRAASQLLLVRIALLVYPLRRLQPRLVRLAPTSVVPAAGELDRLARAVERASAVIPGATCLPRALVLQATLARRGVETRLHVGFVRRAEDRAIRGHAWLEHQGRVLIGGGDLSGFETLLTLGAETRSTNAASVKGDPR